MKENSIEEYKNSNFSIEAKFESMIKMAKEIISQNKEGAGDCSIETALAYDVAAYLSDYKRVLKENEKYKRLAKMNLKNAEEFKNNMCEHRCLLKNENKEQKELIEKMKKYLLKENKMCDFLESEE